MYPNFLGPVALLQLPLGYLRPDMFVTAAFLSLLAVASAGLVSPRSYKDTVANQTTCDGTTYKYHNLAGYGFIPSNARDKYGDTIGGIGSSIAIDQSSWKKNRNGTYTGILWAIPDRGWYESWFVQMLIHAKNIS